jgi:hypothetical protein
MMKQNLTGMEGFVIKMYDGTMIKWKTDWWRKHRHQWRFNLFDNGKRNKLPEEIYMTNALLNMSTLERKTFNALVTLFDVQVIPFAEFGNSHLDFYIPAHSLGFEVQGGQHFKDQQYRGDFNGLKDRDNLKRKLCEEKGITLLEVGYWWDGSPQSLQSTITQIRPDVTFNYSEKRYEAYLNKLVTSFSCSSYLYMIIRKKTIELH